MQLVFLLLLLINFSSVHTFAQSNNSSQVEINDLPEKEDMTCISNYPDLLFDFDSPELLPESRKWLKDIARDFNNLCPDHLIKINGYAAAVNNDSYNKKLSKKRSEKVSSYLIKQGVPEDKVKINWHGDNNASNKEELLKNKKVNIEFAPIPKGSGGKL